MRSSHRWMFTCLLLGASACEANATPVAGRRSGAASKAVAEPDGNAGAHASTAPGDTSENGAPPQTTGGPTVTPPSASDNGATTSDGGAPPTPGCTALTAETYENNEGNDAEFTAKFFPTKDRDNEYIDMFFRSAQLGTHTYGAGGNADLYTCAQCLLVVRNGKNFYPTAGSISVLAGSEPTKKKLVAKLSQLTLVEIQITSSYHSVKVPGGECITLAPANINVK